MKTVIIVGGNGYIGAEIINQLVDTGKYNIINIDKDITEKFDDNPKFEKLIHLYQNMSLDPPEHFIHNVKDAINGGEVVAMICLAAHKDLSESLKVPFSYYDNNIKVVLNSINLANMFNCKRFILSSSAAVYKDTERATIYSDLDYNGSTPYAYSKLVTERITYDACYQLNINPIILRYFNPIGDTEVSKDESDSLFGSIKYALNHNEPAVIFGSDYDTPDGTCIRDYIDVRDVADAHLFFIDSVNTGFYNIGRGTGFTVKEVMDTVKVAHPQFEYNLGSRRDGDTVGGFADITELSNLGWKPKYDLKDSILTMKLDEH